MCVRKVEKSDNDGLRGFGRVGSGWRRCDGVGAWVVTSERMLSVGSVIVVDERGHLEEKGPWSECVGETFRGCMLWFD